MNLSTAFCSNFKLKTIHTWQEPFLRWGKWAELAGKEQKRLHATGTHIYGHPHWVAASGTHRVSPALLTPPPAPLCTLNADFIWNATKAKSWGVLEHIRNWSRSMLPKEVYKNKQTNKNKKHTQNFSLENVLQTTETHRTKCITRLFLYMQIPCCCFAIVADLMWNSNQASPDSVLCSSVLLGMKQQAQPLSLFHVFFSLNTNQGAAESFGYYSTEKIFSSSFLVSSSWLQFLLVVFAWK